MGVSPRATPLGRTGAAAAIYLFEPDRKAERPASHLEHFKGVLHVDGYAGFEQLTSKGDIVLAACWSHRVWAPSRAEGERKDSLLRRDQ
ncbi:IS66 family transposase [Mesorhizobium sp. M0751]|uniref:IS66 family transposase n=1 Tax=unclassified Mesorhizobium TaxID=325217 RepID=UPI003338D9F4